MFGCHAKTLSTDEKKDNARYSEIARKLVIRS
jgi:hypothetical protein